MSRASWWPSGPASFSAHGSTNSRRGPPLAPAPPPPAIGAVLDAELWASTPAGVLFLVEVRHQPVVGGGHAHRQLGRRLLLVRIAGVHVRVVLAHQLAVRRLDLRHVGADLKIEHAVPLQDLGLGRTRPWRASRARAGMAVAAGPPRPPPPPPA